MRVFVFAGLVTFVLSPLARGEQPEEIEELEEIEEVAPVTQPESGTILLDRGVALMTARTTRKNALLFVIDHRNRKTFLEDTFRDYFGFDGGGLKIGLGLRYGLMDELDIGFYRTNGSAEVFDTYEFDAKYRFLEQDEYFFDLALRAGVTWYYQPDQEDAVGAFGQLLLGKTLFDRLTLGTGLLFHSESSNDVKSNRDDDWSLAVQALVEIRILPWLAWNVEMAANLAGYGAKWPIFSSSVKFVTHRHTFSLMVSNSQYTSADGVVANTWRGFDEIVIGFAITREFQF